MTQRCPDHDVELDRQFNPTTGRHELVCPVCRRNAQMRAETWV